MENKRPAIFFDRDGVINIEKNYVYQIKDFEFTDGIFELIYKAKQNNYLIFIITNQAGIGRGFYTEDQFNILNDWMLEKFKSKKAKIDKVYFCPHHPKYGKGKYLKDSHRRKPNPGMIEDACNEFPIDITNSIMVGDKISDIEAGISAGIRTNLLYSKKDLETKGSFAIIKKISDVETYLIQGN